MVGLGIAAQVATLNTFKIPGRAEMPNSKVSSWNVLPVHDTDILVQLARALRSLTEPAQEVSFEVLVEQTTSDVIAAEKLLALEPVARRRDARPLGDKRQRDSRVLNSQISGF